MGRDWPLVGRAGELRHLRALMSADDLSGAVIAGPAGVGKTRLAHEMLRVAETAGLPTAKVTATRAAATLPFGALASLLPATDHGDAGGVDDRADLLRRSAAALVNRAGGKRFVFLVDDAHLLDDASATLVHQLATGGAAFVLATVRSREPAPEPIVSLWKDGAAERLELDGLDLGAVEELLATILAGPVEPASADLLFRRCLGNVLFLRELVLGALHDGSLRDDGGLWRLVGALSPSHRLAELVEIRLGRLEPAERDLLELVSFGEPLGLAELESLADPAMVEDLVRKGLLFSTMDRRRVEVRLAHPVYGDVLRSRLPAIRARAVARALAGAVEGTGARRREDTLRVATWSLEGGIPRPGLMLAAAATARWRYDFALAERLVAGALESGAGFDAALLAAQLAALTGRSADAEEQLGKLWLVAADDAQRAVVAVNRIDALGAYMGHMEEALRLAEEAERAIADPVHRHEVTARRGVMLFALQGPRAGADLTVPLLDTAQGRSLVWACMIASFSLAHLGRIDEALAIIDRGQAEHLALTQPIDRYPWIHAWLRCEALAQAGRFAEAEALAEEQYRQGVKDVSAEAQAYFAWHLATVVGDRGHVRTAAGHAREGIALNRDLGRPHYVGECLIGLAMALALSGKPRDAARALKDFDALDLPAASVFKPVQLTLARAWTAVAGGDLPAGQAGFEAAVEQAAGRGDRVEEATALHCMARLGAHDSGLAGRLAALAGGIDGGLAAARAAHVTALVARDAEALLASSETFEGMGADLLAAEAAADAAVAWQRAGEPRRTAVAEHRAARLVELCQGAVTPALHPVASRSQLTPSERRAALLAAAGHPNRRIADELCVSVRTIENHLSRVYEKLGIAGRSELATALHESPAGGATR